MTVAAGLLADQHLEQVPQRREPGLSAPWLPRSGSGRVTTATRPTWPPPEMGNLERVNLLPQVRYTHILNRNPADGSVMAQDFHCGGLRQGSQNASKNNVPIQLRHAASDLHGPWKPTPRSSGTGRGPIVASRLAQPDAAADGLPLSGSGPDKRPLGA
jgi:hypothetical protein